MRKKFFLYPRLGILLFLFQWCTIILFARENENQSGSVKGRITTTDGQPAPFVTVELKELGKRTSTDEGGNFYFINVPHGNYTLGVSLTGYAAISRNIVVGGAKVIVANVQLTASDLELDEVIVTSGKNRFAKKETDMVAKMPLKNMENPQVYTAVAKELMKEQVTSNYNDAFKNVPGAGVAVVYNQGRSQLLSRGFSTANLVRNGVGGFNYTNIDPANLERIEVIKGPSATLFGSVLTSFGGLFNRVTKKPFDSFKGEVSYMGASFDLNRLTLDFNTPLNQDKSALFRINGALHSEKSFQEAGFTKSVMVAPSFSYQVNEKLSFLLDAEISSYNATSPVRFAPAVTPATGAVKSIKGYGMNYNLSYGNNTLDYNTSQINVFGQMIYKMSPQWTSQTVFSRTYSTTRGYVLQLVGVTDSTLKQSAQKVDFPYYGTDLQQNFIGDFKIGSVRNRFVVGLDYFSIKSDYTQGTVTMPVINFKKPGAAYNNYNVDRVNSLLAAATYSYYRTNQNTYSVYASDVLNLTDNLLAMASVRIDRYDNKGTYYPANDSTVGAFAQTAVSPKFGLVYQIIKNKISLFGNYMNGFNNQTGTDFYGNTFKPQQANQAEGGIKLDVFDHKLTATFSYYDISVSNTTRDDTAHAGYSIQDGTQLSKGFEAEVVANPITGLNIIAGYSYNDSKYEKAAKTVQGLRPNTAGPATLINLWASYRISKGNAKGLGVGVGGNYGSSSFQTNTSTFVFTIPSYATIDASIFYDQPRYRLSLKGDNLTNQQYWSFRLAPQNPTRITGSITFKF